METGEYYLTQEHGSFPTILADCSARSESGVSVLSLRFLQGLHFRAKTQDLSGFSRRYKSNAAWPTERCGMKRH
jgi:hypothetical protein